MFIIIYFRVAIQLSLHETVTAKAVYSFSNGICARKSIIKTFLALKHKNYKLQFGKGTIYVRYMGRVRKQMQELYEMQIM